MSPFRDSRNESAWGSRNSRNASSPRPRNPRFAPEFLERRLSPSSFGVAPTFAQVSTMSTAARAPRVVVAQEPLPTDQNCDPIPVPASGDEPGPGAGV